MAEASVNEKANAFDLNSIFGAVAKMTVPIQELEAVHAELRQHETPPHHTPSPHGNAHSPKFKFLKKQGKEAVRPDDYFDVKPPVATESLVKQFGQALAIIKAQHDILATTITHLSQSASASASSPIRTYASRSSAFVPRTSTSSRASSVNSAETEDMYEDALQGEFVLEEAYEGDSSSEEEEDFEADNSFASVEEDDRRHTLKATLDDTDAVTVHGEGVRRRHQLPAPISGDEFSMLGMLRKNVGKDLSTISFPVTMNEPLSALQRIAEELEYSELLHRASATEDSIDRLALVACFAISGAAGNKYRTSRKPFNPLLGETYECIRPDRGFRFISEKVSHHPPIMAFHADSKGWTIDGHVAPTQKFWGRSMEVFVTGDFHITFTDTGETFSIRKPSSFVRNLVAGSKYLEVVGDLIVSNDHTGEQATVTFKEGSAWGGLSSRNKIEGKVCDDRGRARVELVGRWDEHVDRKEGQDSYQRLWQISEFPPHAQSYYGFSKFAVELNEITSLETDATAPTDSRLRPDQRALEDGDVDAAEEIKKRVEEKQRAKRSRLSEPSPPQFFAAKGEGWVYGGKYFDIREKKTFVDPDIF